MKATGLQGELRVGYQRGAQLGAWSLDTGQTSPLRSHVEAEVLTRDEFWSTQGLMTLDLQFGRFHWVWDAVHPVFQDGRVTLHVVGKPQMTKE